LQDPPQKRGGLSFWVREGGRGEKNPPKKTLVDGGVFFAVPPQLGPPRKNPHQKKKSQSKKPHPWVGEKEQGGPASPKSKRKHKFSTGEMSPTEGQDGCEQSKPIRQRRNKKAPRPATGGGVFFPKKSQKSPPPKVNPSHRQTTFGKLPNRPKSAL